MSVSSTKQTVLPLFITGLWRAIAAARVINIIVRGIQSNNVGILVHVVGGEPSFVVGIFASEILPWSLILSRNSWGVVSSFIWMDGFVSALILLYLKPLESVDLRFMVTMAGVGVLLVVVLWFSIRWLFVSFVDWIVNRWIGSRFVLVAAVLGSCSILLVDLGICC